MKRILTWALFALVATAAVSCGKYRYETVKGDPLGTKIYTLDNGLKVYMSVNKETPRLQTYIAVRVGSKNDPHETTGLAHYLEHLMFKGTEQFGTSDYAAEKPLLDTIRALFETYRTLTDAGERAALYHRIDSVSYEASKIAIPNEYDKLMSIIGAEGTNAFTSNDMTVYTEDIPANRVDDWARIQADRFRHPVIRGFHTELEAVYEEKNMSLTEDDSKAMEAIDSVLFARHPYGLQTTLGTQEHLKNPSIVNIENYRSNFYVPNNIAICASGDLDPDAFVAAIEKYFGDWEPNPDIKMLEYEPEDPVTAPVRKDVYGLDAEFVMIGWRTPGGKDFRRSEVGDIVSAVLYNGKAGLVDLDLVKSQKIGDFYAFNYTRPDYGEFLMVGYPREGQTLEEVRDLLLGEVERLRKGDFGDSLVRASVNNLKLGRMRQLEQNRSRAMSYVNSFIAGHDWKDDALQMDRLEKVDARQVADWASEFLAADSYVAAFKHIGPDPNIEKIAAPAITPIETNRQKQSAFLTEIQQSEVVPIDPVFLDFSQDLSTATLGEGVRLLYKRNGINDIATLGCSYDLGTQEDPRLNLAFRYLGYLGTPSRTAEQIAAQMYALACNWRLTAGASQSHLSVTGLDEHVGEAFGILEDLVLHAVGDEQVLASLKRDILKERADEKLSQRSCYAALSRYLTYGPEYIARTTLTDDQVRALTSEELLSLVRDLYYKQHNVLYYGPSAQASVEGLLDEVHDRAQHPQPLQKTIPVHRRVDAPAVYLAPYKANQFYYMQYSDRGEKFDVRHDAATMLFNQYFGAGMNGIVFQEMREARALAYSASALLRTPDYKDDDYIFTAFIASQNDKLKAAVEGFDEIIEQMPASEEAFQVAKSGLVSTLRTNRTTGLDVLYAWLDLEDLGLTEDRNKAVFEQVQDMTLEDVKAVQRQWIAGRTYAYGFLGDAEDFDMDFVSTLGPVTFLTLEDIFGY